MAVKISHGIVVYVTGDGTSTSFVVDLMKHPYVWHTGCMPVNWFSTDDGLVPSKIRPDGVKAQSSGVVSSTVLSGTKVTVNLATPLPLNSMTGITLELMFPVS